MNVVLAVIAGFIAARFVIVASREMLEHPMLERVNYRQAAVWTAAGIVLVTAVLFVEAGRSMLGSFGLGDRPGLNPARPLVLFACFGFGLLGVLDDVLGSDDRGFVGHARALVHGRLTTGLLKLVGGGAVALVLAASPGFVTGKRLVADALLIALAANLGNLLDRAPGRTVKWTLVAYVPLAVAAGTGAVGVAVAPVIGAALGILPEDLRERVMLGDTGANVLGGVLGLAAVLTLGRGTRNGILVVLVILNALSEIVSFSAVIERVPPLRWFDRLFRPYVPVPVPPLAARERRRIREDPDRKLS